MKAAGVIKKRRAYYGESSEECLQAFKEEKKHKAEEQQSAKDITISQKGSGAPIEARGLSLNNSRLDSFADQGGLT